MKLMRSVRKRRVLEHHVAACLADQAVAEHQSVLLVAQFGRQGADAGMTWKAVSNSPSGCGRWCW